MTTKRRSVVGAVVTLSFAPMFGCSGIDGLLCSGDSCELSETDRAQILSLADLPAQAPPDPSNKYVGDPAAAAFGKQLFYDTRFSGPSTVMDSLNRPMPYGRVAKGQNTGVGCISCHDPNHASVDPSSYPGNVSIGAGWGFSNALPIYNSVLYKIQTWNGRLDSLWAQALADNENALTTNGNRLHTAWLISDLYHDQYQAVFASYPLPFDGLSATWQPLLETDGALAGQCKLVTGACPANCRVAVSMAGPSGPGPSGCWPRFPLQGKPGKVAGCQAGAPTEPFGDAFDCMAADDSPAVTRVLVNYAKAIAAYESTLVTGRAPFDRWVTDLRNGAEKESTAISEPAKRGARLFVGKAGCSDCHSTPLFSDSKFHNIGIAQVGTAIPTEADCPAGGVCDCASVSSTHAAGPKNCLPWGARDGIDKLQHNGFRRDSAWSDDVNDGSRLGYVNMDLGAAPKGGYRTPSLRNVALTPPYMHNGSIATLWEVIDHYNNGGGSRYGDEIGALASQIKPLYLSVDEEGDLMEFLSALSCDPPPLAAITAPILP
jgi:cytochrome c peroxidase